MERLYRFGHDGLLCELPRRSTYVLQKYYTFWLYTFYLSTKSDGVIEKSHVQSRVRWSMFQFGLPVGVVEVRSDVALVPPLVCQVTAPYQQQQIEAGDLALMFLKMS